MAIDLLPATAADADLENEAGYWLTAVEQRGELWGFELLDGEQKPIVQFLYPDEVAATTARVAIADATWGASAILGVGELIG